MKFYNQQHQYYCGIDLHARKMYVCILDQKGKTMVHENIKTDPEAFSQLISSYLDDIVVGVECVFCWYWVSDLCAKHQIPFVLGHALYMKAIHGGKTKNDKIDSYKIALLLKGGNFPTAYQYPAEWRATRDLLRRRMYLVRRCGELVSHIQNTFSSSTVPARLEEICSHAPGCLLEKLMLGSVSESAVSCSLGAVNQLPSLFTRT